MGTENYNSDRVLMAEANILVAPRGTTKPSSSTIEVNDFTNWPALWLHLGHTETGPNFNYAFEVAEARSQQSGAALKRRKNNETVTIPVNLMQWDAQNIAYATGGSITHTAAGAGQKEVDVVKFGGESQMDSYMAAIESWMEDEDGEIQPVRLFFPNVTIRSNGETVFARNGAALLPILIEALIDDSLPIGEQLGEYHIVTADATS